MKVLVIGSSVLDEIHQKNKIEIKPGGIFYTIAGLLSQLNSNRNLTIDLITNYKQELNFYFEPIFRNVNLLSINANEFMPNVKLIVHEDKEREEIFSGFTKSLTIPEEIEFSNYDAILINLISGIDIPIEKLEQIREKFNGIIYLDIHSLSRGFDKNNNRIFRTIQNSERWLNSIDIIQCNENELFTLFNFTKKQQIIDKIFQSKIKYLIVTKGKSGAELYTNKAKLKNNIVEKLNVINTVGCGDIFGAVYFSSYISNNNYELALQKSVNVSSDFTQFKNVFEFLEKGKETK